MLSSADQNVLKRMMAKSLVTQISRDSFKKCALAILSAAFKGETIAGASVEIWKELFATILM